MVADSFDERPEARKRPEKGKQLKELQASPQEQLPPVYVSMRELFNERHRYEVFPPFQRQQCWPLRQQQAFIDSILLGDPVPPLEGYQEYNIQGESIWGIVDGHQRISAALGFMDKMFKTWTSGQKRSAEPNSDPPVEPGKFFDQLSVIAKNYFLDYRLQINRVRRKSEVQMATRFLRIQNHMPLSAAEKLNVYMSNATEAARRIEKHSFWEDFYEGKKKREQLLQSSLYLLAIEMTQGGILDLQSWSFIHGLAAGKRDSFINESLVEAVLNRLDVVSHVYSGTFFTIRAAVVPMYQSVMFLEQSGYTVQSGDKGLLTKWIKPIMDESKRATGISHFHIPIQHLLRESVQREFWDKHLKTVLGVFRGN